MLFILMFTVSSFSSAASGNDSISLDEARGVAYRFIVSSMVGQKEADREGWEQGIKFGTLPGDFGYGIWKYFYGDCNVTTAYSADRNVSVSDIKNSISYDRPFGLAVYGHQLYKNHMVLGLGWEQFKYSNGYTSLYIRIVDGWSTSPNRFIHHTVGLDSVVMCRAYPQ